MNGFVWKGWYSVIIVFAFLFIGAISAYSYANGVRNTGIQLEQKLSATYSDNENYLSNYVSKVFEQFGVAKYKTAAMDSIIRHAVQGRYGPNGFSAQGSFFAAVKEAYPDISGLNSFDRIIETVSAGRDEFRGRQSMLLDEIRAYDTWRQSGLVQHVIISSFGFPSENLRAQIGDKIVAQGPEALTKMRELVLTSSTTDAFQSGHMEPLNLNH